MIYLSWLKQIFHTSALKIQGVVIALGGIAHKKKARSGRTAAMRSGQEQTGHRFRSSNKAQTSQYANKTLISLELVKNLIMDIYIYIYIQWAWK